MDQFFDWNGMTEGQRVQFAKMKLIMPLIMNPVQSAFIKGRSITEKIMLSNDLIHNFHLHSRGEVNQSGHL